MALRGALCALTLLACAAVGAAHGDAAGCAAHSDEFFPFLPHHIPYDPNSTDPLVFRYYNKNEVIHGKTMAEWFRFSIAFWHTFRGDGSDPFGAGTKTWPWNDPSLAPMERAEAAMRANFELMDKLGVDYWCFHDRDIAPEGATLTETNANLDKIVALAEQLQGASGSHATTKSGKRPLWGTASLFTHPRYQNGAATSPQATVFARAAAQVKKAMDVTHRLGGLNYVFWGGREGYTSLLNTDMGREQAHLAAFLRMAVAHKRALGWAGTLLIEPKPKEPSIHQYDFDAATTLNFLREHGLQGEFKLNIECNHATLAGHSCPHELETARLAGALGNIDANTGDPLTGWDTDQFLTEPREAALVMASVLRNGGLAPGGFNFDAKLRRESIDLEDLVIAHVAGMDALARGLRAAVAMQQDGRLEALVKSRYASWDATQLGNDIEAGKMGFKELEQWALAQPAESPRESGKQELAERLLDIFI